MALSFINAAGSFNSIRHLNNATNKFNSSLEKLSSGFKINKASDGPANLLVSENLRSQIRGSQVAMENVQQGMSMLDIADSALQSITGYVQRINEIAVSAQNGTVTTAQFAAYEDELTELVNAINSVTSSTKYGSNVLLDGSISSGATFNIQAGPNADSDIDIASAFGTATASAMGLTQVTLATAGDASGLASDVNAMLSDLATKMSVLGGYRNRMDSAQNVLAISVENLSAAESSIRNTDVAQETANLARYQILQQAATYSLSQVNMQPSLALSLLR